MNLRCLEAAGGLFSSSFKEKIMSITALSPLDGRYESKVADLQDAFSEFALIRCRVLVEVLWLKALCAEKGIPECRALSKKESLQLDAIIAGFTPAEAEKVKSIEKTTNHDVKAVEYYLKEKVAGTSLDELGEFWHFACTSEDINNLSHALMLKQGREILAAEQNKLITDLSAKSKAWKAVPLLARTHGQTASPTTIGKELAVFVSRLRRAAEVFQALEIRGKLNGAVGNYNAHLSAYPDVNWPVLAKGVIEGELGLVQNSFTTQIEPHDYMAEMFDALARFNTILLDLDRDIWTYISFACFKQKTVKGEIGSSTMPHKVNPIDFENSEGNIGLANALLRHMSEKLPISRLQRDLTDSTVLRNMGVAFGYALLAYSSTLKGLGKLELNENKLAADLANAWEVLAEPIQTVMRKAGIEKPYEKLKELTRGKTIDQAAIHDFIKSLELDGEDKARLLELTPASYIGLAVEIAEDL
ncbi:MAG: adenylosuccinate lyase [Verrucomicrobia bacterium]|nr:adenylosuccinate lyase [Verrucomicrobiota bacterium]